MPLYLKVWIVNWILGWQMLQLLSMWILSIYSLCCIMANIKFKWCEYEEFKVECLVLRMPKG